MDAGVALRCTVWLRSHDGIVGHQWPDRVAPTIPRRCKQVSNNDVNQALRSLHDEMADTLAKAIKAGVPVRDYETGAVHIAPASAALMTVALALLKHNNITAVATKTNGLGKLQGSIASMPMPSGDMQRVLQSGTD